MLSSLLNILWVVLGGLMMALGWWLAGLICAITVVGTSLGSFLFRDREIFALALWAGSREPQGLTRPR